MKLAEHRARRERWAREYQAGAQVWDMARRDAVDMGTIYCAIRKVIGPSPRFCGVSR